MRSYNARPARRGRRGEPRQAHVLRPLRLGALGLGSALAGARPPARLGHRHGPAGPARAHPPHARQQGALGRALPRAEGQDLRRLPRREPRRMASPSRPRKLTLPGGHPRGSVGQMERKTGGRTKGMDRLRRQALPRHGGGAGHRPRHGARLAARGGRVLATDIDAEQARRAAERRASPPSGSTCSTATPSSRWPPASGTSTCSFNCAGFVEYGTHPRHRREGLGLLASISTSPRCTG